MGGYACKPDDKTNKWTFSQFNTCQRILNKVEILHLHGNIEVQLCEGEEADLHKHYDECKKNPGHPQFTPALDFKMEHLPEGYHDTKLYDLIKATADLTVRLAVKKTSPYRPMFWPETNVPYPFYNLKRNVDIRTGSGEIAVFKFIDGQGYSGYGKTKYALTGKNIKSGFSTCPCDECVDSDKPNRIWWEIRVQTAAHVVFDEFEARHTSCRLFYDSDDSPVVKLDTFILDYVDIETDDCQLKYVTCKDFGKQLYEMYVHWCDLKRTVWNKYWKGSDVIFIVSHPHGCSKQVSVGKLVDNHKVGEYNIKFDITKLTYTAGTCSGSSGAKVYCVGSNAGGHTHTGYLDFGLNYSCISLFKRKDDQ